MYFDFPAELNRHVKILEKKLEMVRIEEPEPDKDVLPECCKGENTDFNAASSVLELR